MMHPMYACAFLFILSIFAAQTLAGYTLVGDWSENNFFNNFNFYSGRDPSNGYVYYATQDQANSWAYTFIQNGQVIIRSDSWTVVNGSDPGRGSVRLESKNVYQRGLFIFDVAHMPFGCGTWPALWTSNLKVWPAGGEIDILEGINNNNVGNTITLHTSPGCTFPTGQNHQTGTTVTGDCGANNGDLGCSVKEYDVNSYGTQFNNNGGGVFATQWESSGIYIWFFPRNAIPADITSNAPNTTSWGLPVANFDFETCNNSFFYDQQIILDTNFCGAWADTFYGAMCGGDCESFVANNPGSFKEAYWAINSFKIYQ